MKHLINMRTGLWLLVAIILVNCTPKQDDTKILVVPDVNRYTHRVLSQGMDEPMQMAILPGDDVLFVERKGAVKLYDDSSKQTKTIAQFEVFSGIEDGLLGVALDPGFRENNWVYFYYAVAGDKSINRLSRMEMRGEKLIMESEVTLLEIPTQRIYCCHSAGYISFGPDGLLYLSTGDNTNAEETEGYVPIDERPGRELSDDQATAANTNDLRGKILRIKPEPNGTYSVPDGNLFPKDGKQGRPEIYVMGCRNPYRFSIDQKNGYVYWGDVGPDTKVPASEGTLSYDEINRARGPGFFGWPYFLGENEAFPHYDFASKKEGPKFDPERPLNQSPHNTGMKALPPAQPAMIWYGDGSSKRFPLVGKGGQSAMAGPVYYADLFQSAPYKLSRYYDGKLFIYDWVRRWFMAITMDEQGNYLRMEPFLDHMEFVAPTDMQFAPDGAIYILEYGTNWFAKNSDARLIRVEYSEGNRKPVANIEASSLHGATPFDVRFSASGSADYDKEDVLTYSWQVEGKEVEGEQFVHTFAIPGTYDVMLRVKDSHGEEGRSTVQIKAGNAAPEIEITTAANRTFYWDNLPFDYRVRITDKEDVNIDDKRVNVSLNYLPHGKDVAVILTNPRAAGNLKFARGQGLLNGLDCKACHSVEVESVGPSYKRIADRYAGKSGAVPQLVKKIIEGGSGNWGERSMSSHPDMPVPDATEIVQYILSLSVSEKSLPMQKTTILNEHAGKGNAGSYLLMASYTDNGANGIEPLYSYEHIALRNPLVEIEDFDEGSVRLGTITTEFLTFATAIHDNGFVRFNNIDLTHVKELRYRVQQRGVGGNVEVRLDSKSGKLVSNLKIAQGDVRDLKEGWNEVRAGMLENVSGVHDLYFVFTNPAAERQNLFHIDWIYFGNIRK
jgi:cytochrome c